MSTWGSLQEALRLIAADDPDRARESNAVGFSGSDGPTGHALARLPVEDWDEEDAAAAATLVRRYRRQLEAHGVDVDAVLAGAPLPEPARVRSERARASVCGRITAEGDEWVIRTPYDPRLVDAIRAIPGRRWDRDARVWRVPAGSDVRVLVERWGLAAEVDLSTPPPPSGRRTLWVEGETIVFRTPYDPEFIANVRAIPGRRWDPRAKVWRVPVGECERALAVARAHGVDAGELEALLALLRQRVEASAALDAEVELPSMGGELLPFQRAGVAYALANRRVLIADEMGLGKTVQAIAAVHAAGAHPAVVVCPASMRLTWAHHVREWMGAEPVVLTGTVGEVPRADWVIVNYDVLAPRLDGLLDLRPRAVVLDESHYVKNAGTRSKPVQRTAAALRLCSSVPADGMVLLLSGTPITNRPRELVTQLQALGVLAAFGGRSSFERRYCGGRQTAFGWQAEGARNLEELHQRLRATCMVRRAKRDVLAELPPRRHAPVWLEPDPHALAVYREAEADVVAHLAERAAQLAAEAGEDVASAAWRARLRAQAAEHLVRITTLRRLAARAVLGSLMAWIEDQLLDDTRKLVVFAHHVETVEALAERFTRHGVVVVRGDTSMADRQAAVEAFQNDPGVRVFVGNIRAAGVGLTLTAASDVVFAELAWTPAEHDQAIDRCHGRLNDPHPAVGWYALAADTIAADMWELLGAKRRVVTATLDGGRAKSDSILADLVVRLAERGLKRES